MGAFPDPSRRPCRRAFAHKRARRHISRIDWNVEGTDEFAEWFGRLTDERRIVIAAIERLGEAGPTLGRPLVDTLVTSRIANLKELRPTRGIRILFVFDPRRTAILLLGGDKAGDWSGWYERMIPMAEALYETYLQELRREGLIE